MSDSTNDLLRQLDLFSPGSIPNIMTIESMPLRQYSRNELITSLLSRCAIPKEHNYSGRATMMDKRGEGIPIIFSESEKLSHKKPVYRLIDDELLLTIYPVLKALPPDETIQGGTAHDGTITGHDGTGHDGTVQVPPHDATPHDATPHDETGQVSRQVIKLIQALGDDCVTRKILMERLGLQDRVYFFKSYLQPALKLDLIEMTIPDKPQSHNQRYRKKTMDKTKPMDN